MPITGTQTDADCERARRYWAEYQQTHDVSVHHGQAVGIDPQSGEVFFGESAGDIMRRLDTEGRFRVLYVVRVGFPYYGRMRHGVRC